MNESGSSSPDSSPGISLGESNFATWKNEFERWLREKNLWQYIEEDQFTSVAQNVLLSSYHRLLDSIVKTQLISHISDSDVRSDVENLPTARDIWLKLGKIYNLKNQARKGILLENILTFPAMQDGHDIRKIVTSFFKKVDQLNEFGRRMDSELFSIILLNKLPPSFKHFKRAIFSREEFPGLRELLHEIFKKYSADADARDDKFRAGPSGETPTKQPYCIFCSEAHNCEICAHKILNESNTYVSAKIRRHCSKCTWEGHYRTTCPYTYL